MRTTWAAAILLAATAAAMAGDLKYVAFDSADALEPGVMFISNGEFSKPAEDAGTLSRNAVCFSLFAGRINIAIDADKDDAAGPNLLRIDFTGKNSFKDAPTIPLAPQVKGGSQRTFGPVSITATIDGVARPVTVSGFYYRQEQYRYCQISLATVAQTACVFGDKTRPVRLVDMTGDFRFSGPVKGAPTTASDTVIVDVGDGSFKQASRAFFGQPVRVDGKWYTVVCDADGNNIAAKVLDLPTASVKVDQPSWRCKLVGKAGRFMLVGGTAEVEVPAGDYTIAGYSIPGDPQIDANRPEISGRQGRVSLEAGKTTALPLGSPITVKVNASVSGRDVRFAMSAIDASGSTIDSITLGSGVRPEAPKIQVIDASGAVIYKNTLEYG